MVVYGAVSAQLGVAVTEISGVATLTVTGPSTVTEDTPNTFSGRLTGGVTGLSGKTIALSYLLLPSGTETFIMNATTDMAGVWTASITFANPGNYNLIARWAGGSA